MTYVLLKPSIYTGKNTSHLPGPTMEFPMFPVERWNLKVYGFHRLLLRIGQIQLQKNPRDSPRLDLPCLHTLNLLKTNVWNDGINSWGLHYWQFGSAQAGWNGVVHVKHGQLESRYLQIHHDLPSYRCFVFLNESNSVNWQLSSDRWTHFVTLQKKTGWPIIIPILSGYFAIHYITQPGLVGGFNPSKKY